MWSTVQTANVTAPPHPLQNDSIYPWVNSAESWQLPQLRPGTVGGKLPSQAPLRISFPFNFHPGRRRLGRAARLSYICNIIFPTTHTTELCFLVKWELYFQITDFPPKPCLCPGDLLQWVKPQSSLSGVSEMIQNRIKTITLPHPGSLLDTVCPDLLRPRSCLQWSQGLFFGQSDGFLVCSYVTLPSLF